MKIVFMGTPDFAVPTLQVLLENNYEVVGVVTATDKWGGRGNKTLLESDVKKFAQSKGLNILQPQNLKSPEFQAELKALEADLFVIVAFRMLPEAVWSMPPYGSMNIHASLLPKYRGAAPIHWAVINGEKETGVSSFLLKHEIDTGDILYQAKTPIGDDETSGEVYDRLKVLGARLALKSVQTIKGGGFSCTPQDASQVTKAPKIFHQDAQINFDQPTSQVYNFVRGMTPFPTAWFYLDGDKMKVFKATPEQVHHHQEKPGTIHAGKRSLKVATQDGYLHLLEIQPHKRKRMDAASFLNGHTITTNRVEFQS